MRWPSSRPAALALVKGRRVALLLPVQLRSRTMAMSRVSKVKAKTFVSSRLKKHESVVLQHQRGSTLSARKMIVFSGRWSLAAIWLTTSKTKGTVSNGSTASVKRLDLCQVVGETLSGL